ncbi:MAG TPA: sigma-54 dependent transcriptional regulator, partial [Pyrinomonadaceae bacterium]|nr:sigma-54 dependent transcriptional regulator [Pyrinomonadaceae bacterium]
DGETLTIRYPDARVLIHSKIPKARRTDLHARCFTSLQAAGYKDSVLADHAFQGEMLEIAGKLFRSLSRKFFDQKDYINAGRYYGLALGCDVKESAHSRLDPQDYINLARCYARQGHTRKAMSILSELLESKAVQHDSRLLSSVYSALASPLVEDSAEERVRLLKLSIEVTDEGSPEIVHRYLSLALALLSLGNLTAARTALKTVQSHCSTEEDLREVEVVLGSILMNEGDFREAARCFSGTPPSVAAPGSVSHNLAICVEHLGDLKRARDIQATVLHEVESTGSLVRQIVSLVNLGSMESKLGNIHSAESFFALAQVKVRGLARQQSDQFPSYMAVFADIAMVSIYKGDYRNAQIFLASLDKRSTGLFFPIDRFTIGLVRCELHLALGQEKLVEASLADTRQLALDGEFFEVERILIEERLRGPSTELVGRLEEALRSCERLGTLYQGVRVRLALARQHLSLGDKDRARAFAEAARRISAENGYKPLEAKSLLLSALSIEGTEQTEKLKRSLELAAEMRFAPLLAETAFHLGALRLSSGDYAGAQDFLAKTISITSRLADDLTSSDRKTYLSRAQNYEARTLFNDVSRRAIAVSTNVIEWLDDKEKSLFARLYRLAATMSAASDLSGAMTTLLQALREAVTHSIVVVSGIGPKAVYYPTRITLSEDLRRRVMGVASTAGDKPYIAGNGMHFKEGTVVWMPIPSLMMKGGIYVENAAGSCFLDERDIEFLTIVAAISGSVFDHLCTKTVSHNQRSSFELYGIVGTSLKVLEVCERIDVASKNAATVLIEGESGTGKELVARGIHQQSSRAKGPFVPVDCGALPEGLIEAELFGAKKGAYTGAMTDRQGLFEAANQGTIFLDEISNLGVASQAKLLRVLQEREIRKIGSMTGKAIDVRLVAATNCNLERLVREGKFREDLLYRLKVLHILMPPLRERKDDIPALATTFLERLNTLNQSRKFFGPRVMQKFIQHNYPGNVRELQNAVERAFYTSPGAVISEVDFFRSISQIDSPGKDETESWFKDLTEGRENFWSAVQDRYKRRDISRERVLALVDFGLRRTGGNYKTMASMLQIPKEEYRRFMDFLRRSHCLLDFRPYRKRNDTVE